MVNENELAVFFRNNHFSTLTKHGGTLFLLATDIGYLHEADLVWERLDQVACPNIPPSLPRSPWHRH